MSEGNSDSGCGILLILFIGFWLVINSNNKRKFVLSSYEGETNKKGKPHGKGVAIDDQGNRWDGEFVNGLPEGQGHCKIANSDIFFDEENATWASYEGSWKKGSFHGKGVLRGNNCTYEGDFRNHKPHGKGIHHQQNGGVYNGDFRMGFCHGKGTLIGEGYHYEGGWKKDKRNGQGVQYFPDGRIQKGEFKDDKLQGWGTDWNPDGSVHFHGIFNQGIPQLWACYRCRTQYKTPSAANSCCPSESSYTLYHSIDLGNGLHVKRKIK